MRSTLAFATLLFCANAYTANAPCDANVPVKGCRAEVKLDGNFVVLTSNTSKCSAIE
jgi:hypothetical protein